MRSFPVLLGLFLLPGCPYIGDQKWVDEVQDVDGDGFISDRFGGPDCKDDNPDITDCDSDEDGILTVEAGGEDCDDQNASVFPGAFEVCDGADQDCDGAVDEIEDIESPPQWSADDDGDTWGNPDEVRSACEAPEGYVELERGRDCDDQNADINPTATEFCDELDWNCDGDATANAVDRQEFYADADQDRYAAAGAPSVGRECVAPPGGAVLATSPESTDCDDANPAVHPGVVEVFYDGVDADCAGDDDFDGDSDGSPVTVDCDDLDASVFPGAAEVCDSRDNDCDTVVDDADSDLNDPVNQVPRYVDGDGDGHGDPDTARPFCVQTPVPSGYVSLGDDCADEVETAFPGGLERCDGIDNNCNGVVDDNAWDRQPAFQDGDGDGYGSVLAPILACSGTPNVSFFDTDCDDADPDRWPGALEVCGDTIRQDCSDRSPFDCDDDGFDDLVSGGDDCDDGDDDVNPDADEICDGLDNDCDTLLDDQDPNVDLSTIASWYVDADADGFGDPNRLTIAEACAPRPGEAPNGDDCNDDEATANPEGRETCDGFDNDCDGLTDDDDDDQPVNPPTYWLDLDADSFGDPIRPSATTCSPPGPDWVLNDEDCQPGLAAINPYALEICDGLDNNCDGLADDDDPGAALTQWFSDLDGDGFGQSGDAVAACTQPMDRVEQDGDCDDFDDTRNPGASEVCDGGLDNDCDGLADDNDPELAGLVSWWPDRDADGFGDRGETPVLQCGVIPGYVTNAGDCDDGASTRSPAAQEQCNGQDDDCDDLVDDDDGSLVNAPGWYLDADVDGFGSDLPADFVRSCAPLVGYRSDAGDCDDQDDTRYPNADERCNTADDDCDGLTDDADPDLVDGFFVDGDSDGVGGAPGSTGCGVPPGGEVALGGDCDDLDPAINPQLAEICNGVDDDCNGLADDADPFVQYVLGEMTWPDIDGDGYGDSDPTTAVPGCVPLAGYVANDLDCDVGDAAVSPAAVEFCNGVDDDCDGATDDNPVVGLATYLDPDGDGFGTGPALVECGVSAGRAFLDGDCGEGDATMNPVADEFCDGVDSDCDGVIDDSDPDAPRLAFYDDGDGDDFGAAFVGFLCVAPGGLVTQGGDCRDGDPESYPGSTFDVCDGLDQNCNGVADFEDSGTLVGPGDVRYGDRDGDGAVDLYPEVGCPFGSSRYQTVPGNDCDDDRDDIRPFAPELCDGIDNNCDLLVDDADPALASGTLGYPDVDGDGFGDGAVGAAVLFCDATRFATNDDDCDDSDDAVSPARAERCNLDVDDDCDGLADDADLPVVGAQFFVDFDGDGFGSGDATWCTGGPLRSDNDDDCDDTVGGRYFYPGQSVTVPSAVPYVLGTELQAAIDAVCSPADIRVLSATAASTLQTHGKTLVIHGVSASARGSVEGAAAPLFDQTTAGLTLRDLDLQTVGPGSVLEVTGAAVDLTRVALIGGSASLTGGGLHAVDAQIVADGLELVDNYAGDRGGGVSIDGGLFACADCVFQNNQALNYAGALEARDAIVVLTNTAFVRNPGPGSLTFETNLGGSIFEGLIFEGDGGLWLAGPATVKRVTMTDSGPVTLTPASGQTLSFTDGRLERGGEPGSATVALTGAGIVIFEHNQLLRSKGGDLSTDSTNHTIRHNTLVDSTEAILQVTGGSPVVENNILFTDTLQPSAALTVTGGGSAANVLFNAFRMGTVPPDANPTSNFADTQGEWFQTWHPALPVERWDLHLRGASPAIDKGNPAQLDSDLTAVDPGVFGGVADHFRPYYVTAASDLDEDGLPDPWEIDWFGTTAATGDEDDDADELSVFDEYIRGTDPTRYDTDGDGCFDGIDYFAELDPTLCGGA